MDKQGSEEFKEIFEEFGHAQHRSLFHDLFIDGRPQWREARYELLLRHLKKHFPKQTGNPVLKALHNNEGSFKQRYLRLIKAFRTTYRATLSDLKVLTFLHDFAESLFFTDLSSFPHHLVHSFGGTTPLEIAQAIEEAPCSIKLPLLKRITQFLRGQFNLAYDPFCQENTPYHYFSITRNGATIPVIRMGTPTKEGLFSCITHRAQVNEEFSCFIEGQASKGRRHLYINVQNRLPSAPGSDESARCRALEDFAIRHSDTLTFVSLTKNTDFWQQEGRYARKNSATEFKATFLKQLQTPSTGYFFSAKVPQAHLNDVLDTVHSLYFHSRESLSKAERRDFIELAYVHLIDKLIELFRPTSLNISCKDGIDRAATTASLFFLYDRLKTKETLNPHETEELHALLFAPALLVKKRPPTPSRVQRLLSATTRLGAHNIPFRSQKTKA